MSSELETTVENLAAGVVRAHAEEVDRNASFPEAAIDAFRKEGLLGLLSSREVGGKGGNLGEAARLIERVSQECASTGMVLCMHYSGTAVLEKVGSLAVRKEIAAGRHLSTLAFSEVGSRSHFWASLGSASEKADGVHLSGKKSFITAGNHADAYVWSSKPISAEGASTLWLVPRNSGGLQIKERFDGLGLRGNDSVPAVAEDVVVPAANRLGNDGQGLELMLGVVLPTFNVLMSACSVGLMEGATAAAATHVAGTRHEHLGSSLAELGTIRAFLARMRIATDQAHTLLFDTVNAVLSGRTDAQLRVLESKASAGEAATQVLDLAMRICGGAAFRREVGVERRFRDARAGTIMAPTTDQLYDFIGKALTGLPVF